MKERHKGFTLIELIIVIAILGVISLIAVPNLAGIRQRSQIAADKRTAEQIGKAIRIWYTDTDVNKKRELPSIYNSDVSKSNIIVKLDENSTGNGGIFEDFTDYMSIPSEPKSWAATENGGAYYISTTGGSDDNGVTQKIIVGISDKTVEVGDLAGNSNPKVILYESLFSYGYSAKVTKDMINQYDGSKAGWLYLEQ